jgi:hypothetical protein
MTRKVLFLRFSFAAGFFLAHGQNSVGIGVANPNKNAVLELVSQGSNQGLLVPKLTTTQRTATAFVSSLSSRENGLLVFDQTENKFYFWQISQWQPLRAGSELAGGSGIVIAGNTISFVPQDLQLTGSTLTITNNPSATPISLSAFTGTNTDDQTLVYNGITGGLSITRLTGGPQTITLTPAGPAGGDLTGSFPSPVIANNAITSAKILDATVSTADIADAAINDSKIAPGIGVNKLVSGTLNQVLTTTAGGIVWSTPAFGTVTNVATGTGLSGGPITATGTISLSNTGVTATTYGSATAVPQIAVDAQGRITSATPITISGVQPGGAASGDFTGSYPSPTLASTSGNNIVAAINNAATTSTVNANRLSNSVVLDTESPSGGDVSGTFGAGLTINNSAVTSAKIADATIVNADISATAAIAVSKLVPGANSQVLTVGGGVAQWASFGGGSLINDIGSNNLNGGNSSSTSGTDNAVYGEFAGTNNTGSYNVIMGTQASQAKTGGDLNTIIGWFAGRTSTDHQANTFVGAQAGEFATPSANISTLIGEKAGRLIQGTSNTMVGQRAGEFTTTGFFNVMLGNQTAPTNTTGSRITIIGNAADVGAANLTNATAIGDGTIVNASNKVRIGNTSVSVIEGQVAFTAASDKRLKNDISDLEAGLDFILKLKPVRYEMKNGDGRINWGFIAQDIERILGTDNAMLTIGGDKDRTLGLRYTDFVAPLVKAMQEQQRAMDDMQAKFTEREQKISALETSVKNLEMRNSEMATMNDELEKIKKILGMEASVKNNFK